MRISNFATGSPAARRCSKRHTEGDGIAGNPRDHPVMKIANRDPLVVAVKRANIRERDRGAGSAGAFPRQRRPEWNRLEPKHPDTSRKIAVQRRVDRERIPLHLREAVDRDSIDGDLVLGSHAGSGSLTVTLESPAAAAWVSARIDQAVPELRRDPLRRVVGQQPVVVRHHPAVKRMSSLSTT